ncbi:MAG TPA: OmpW family outer membrane protein [Woeseiaceae bacterium]|nr:OmpW family outer membrane protein [Woeseiaceae bacterium]
MKLLRTGLLAAPLLCFAAPPFAVAEEGDWLFRAGWSQIAPKDDNLTLSPGVKLQVDDDEQFTFDITYMLREHWGVELLASNEWNHGFYVEDAGNRVLGGYVEHLPPTLSLQYHFLPDARFRPYVGAGLNYTIVTGDGPPAVDLDDSLGLAAQLGADFQLTDRWFINAVVRWIDIDFDAALSGSDIGTVEVDPWVYGIHLGYRFGRAGDAAPVAAAATAAAVAPEPEPEPAPAPPPPPPAPADTDGDGVADGNDLCPATPAGRQVGPRGCRCDYTVSLAFGFDSDALTAEDRRLLDDLAENLKRLPYLRGVVEGHTDSRGPEAYNQQLSERRARSAYQYLLDAGIRAAQLSYVGYGESRPVADNDTEEGRALNRRVVVRRTDCR